MEIDMKIEMEFYCLVSILSLEDFLGHLFMAVFSTATDLRVPEVIPVLLTSILLAGSMQ